MLLDAPDHPLTDRLPQRRPLRPSRVSHWAEGTFRKRGFPRSPWQGRQVAQRPWEGRAPAVSCPSGAPARGGGAGETPAPSARRRPRPGSAFQPPQVRPTCSVTRNPRAAHSDAQGPGRVRATAPRWRPRRGPTRTHTEGRSSAPGPGPGATRPMTPELRATAHVPHLRVFTRPHPQHSPGAHACLGEGLLFSAPDEAFPPPPPHRPWAHTPLLPEKTLLPSPAEPVAAGQARGLPGDSAHCAQQARVAAALGDTQPDAHGPRARRSGPHVCDGSARGGLRRGDAARSQQTRLKPRTGPQPWTVPRASLTREGPFRKHPPCGQGTSLPTSSVSLRLPCLRPICVRSERNETRDAALAVGGRAAPGAPKAAVRPRAARPPGRPRPACTEVPESF